MPMRLVLRILRHPLAALSLALLVATVYLRSAAQSQSAWYTIDAAARRHYGLGRFRDGVALYYVPHFTYPPDPRGWADWPTPSPTAFDYASHPPTKTGVALLHDVIPGNSPDTYVILPWWLLLTASAITPGLSAVTLARYLLRGRRRLPHECPACGYDLRATPDPAGELLVRCPECGW